MTPPIYHFGVIIFIPHCSTFFSNFFIPYPSFSFLPYPRPLMKEIDILETIHIIFGKLKYHNNFYQTPTSLIFSRKKNRKTTHPFHKSPENVKEHNIAQMITTKSIEHSYFITFFK